MPRKGRVNRKGNYYHIICRGQRKNPLFFSNDDMDVYMRYFKEELEHLDIELIAYCLIRNHVHILVRVIDDPIYKLMHPLNTRYALYFNKKYDTVGHVFQGRYKCIPITDEIYLYTDVNYINFNAVKHHIVENIEDYRYTSFHCYYDNKAKCLIDITIPHFPTKELFDIDVIFHEDEGYIGTEEDYRAFEKRSDGRQNSRDRDRTSRRAVLKQLLMDALSEQNATLQEIHRNKYSNVNRKVNKVARTLYKKGCTQSEIARLLNYTRAGIHRIIKKT